MKNSPWMLQADVAGNEMTGTISVAEGQFEFSFLAKRSTPAAETKETPTGDATSGGEAALPAEKPDPPTDQDNDDPVTGKWSGEIVSPRGEQEATMELKMATGGAISGVFQSTRGEREITSGSYSADTQAANPAGGR